MYRTSITNALMPGITAYLYKYNGVYASTGQGCLVGKRGTYSRMYG